MRAALDAGCPDPSLPRALASLETLAEITADHTFLNSAATVDAYLAALGEALRFVYVDMVAPFIPSSAHLRVMSKPPTTAPSSKLFVFGLCTRTLDVVVDRRRTSRRVYQTPFERLFRAIAQESRTAEQRAVTIGIFCLAAYFDDDLKPALLDAAITVGLELDPTHPLFYLTRARSVPAPERPHWSRRGLDAVAAACQETASPLYAIMFLCIHGDEKKNMPLSKLSLYTQCVKPWIPAFVDRAILHPLFRGTAGTVDMDAVALCYGCDVCGEFALHLRRGVCSSTCARQRKKSPPPQNNWKGACAALEMAVNAHACASCSGRRGACYCEALKNTIRMV